MSNKDTIYRQAAIDALADYIHNVDKVMGTGHLTVDDCKDAAASVFEELPSVQPERKKGKWIKGAEISNRYLEDVYYCSNCHKQAYWDTDYDQQLFDYCPYCGSFNGGQASE